MREWLAEWQGVEVDQVLTGNGSLQIVDFLCHHLLKPGDVVYTEAPSYDRAITLFRRHKARVVGIPLEADGPDIAALEAQLAKQPPVLFYLIPDFQNPAGATCSGSKRRRLVELAEKHNFILLEDAPYRPLRYRGKEEPTLFAMAPTRTLHMSSFSKLIGPGPRLGFMLGEAATLVKVAKVAEDTYISPNYLAHGIAYEWCRRVAAGDRRSSGSRRCTPRGSTRVSRRSRSTCRTRWPRDRTADSFLSVTLPEGVTPRRCASRGRAACQPQSRRRPRLLP